MRVYHSLHQIGPEARNCVVSIGNFDGVHAGHRQLLRRNLQLAHQHGWVPSALTFDPHPTRVVAPARAPRLLSTIEQRLELMRGAGMQQVFVLPFDNRFAQQSPEDFACAVLAEGVGAKAVLVGQNFRFGRGQSGNVASLKSLGDALGFYVEAVPPVFVRGRVVSSTAVRQLVDEGGVSMACRLLERPYFVEGWIVKGFGIGSKQTVPTLNLDTAAEVLPAKGVYITRTHDLDTGRNWPSITNVGTRPTFDGDGLTIETFVLAELTAPAPERIRLEFLRRVREERRFETPELLKKQILQDVSRAQRYFRGIQRLALSA